jgi:hypothetical protein
VWKGKEGSCMRKRGGVVVWECKKKSVVKGVQHAHGLVLLFSVDPEI